MSADERAVLRVYREMRTTTKSPCVVWPAISSASGYATTAPSSTNFASTHACWRWHDGTALDKAPTRRSR